MNIRKKKKDSCFNNKYSCFIFHPSGNPLSWISFSLEQFRLLCFAQAGSMFSLPGFHPSGNPLLDYWRSQGLVFRFEFLF